MKNIEKIDVQILDVFSQKQHYDKKYSEILNYFLTKAYELVELSNGLYQVEHTIKLNKIALKDYILNSDLCNMLKEYPISNYSIDELKNYMNTYEKQNSVDLNPYRIALELYEKLEEIENIEEEKVCYEINQLSFFLNDISSIGDITKGQYPDLYNHLIVQTKEKYLDNPSIDDKIYHYIIQMLNDIFCYWSYGNNKILIQDENDTCV